MSDDSPTDGGLSGLLGAAGATGPRLERDDLESLAATVTGHDPGEFVDAVAAVCGLSWEGGRSRPLDWLELHHERWWIDVDRPAVAGDLLSVVLAAALVDALDSTVGTGWLARVLPAVCSLPDCRVLLDDGKVSVTVVVRADPTLPDEMLFTVNPTDFAEFVADLQARADDRTWLRTSSGAAVRVDGDGAAVGDRHVLALLGVGATGRYDQTSWTVSAVSPFTDPLLDLLVTAHEAHHAALNSSTAWGALLQCVAIAARRRPSSEFPRVLRELVPRCRRTHEAYATHCSVLDVIGRADPADLPTDSAADPATDPAGALLGRYPAYRAHLDAAVALGPPLPLTNWWRQVAVDAALVACMQPDMLSRLVRTGLDRLAPAQLRDQESPDRRYRVLLDRAPQLWAEVEVTAAEAFGADWPRLRTLDVRSPGARTTELAGVRRDLYRICLDAAGRTLDAAGHPTLTVAGVQAVLPTLVAALTELVGAEAGPPITLDTDSATGALSLFELERVEWHPPLAATVTRFADVGDPAELVSAGSAGSHLYVTVRPAAALRRQFRMAETASLPESGPVVAVQTPAGGDQVRLAIVTEPAELDRLAGVRSDLGVLSSLSAACLRDQDWCRRWLPAFRATRSTTLLDLPFTPVLDTILAAGHSIRYALARVPTTAGIRFAYVLTIESDPPMLVPCTLITGQALANYTYLRSDSQVGPDLAALGPDPHLVRAVVEHLIDDESYADMAL